MIQTDPSIIIKRKDNQVKRKDFQVKPKQIYQIFKTQPYDIHKSQPHDRFFRTKQQQLKITKNYKFKRFVPSSFQTSNKKLIRNAAISSNEQLFYQQNSSLQKALNLTLDQNKRLIDRIQLYQKHNSNNRLANKKRQTFSVLKRNKNNSELNLYYDNKEEHLINKLQKVQKVNKQLKKELLKVQQQNEQLKKIIALSNIKDVKSQNQIKSKIYNQLLQKYNILQKQLQSSRLIFKKYTDLLTENSQLKKQNNKNNNKIEIIQQLNSQLKQTKQNLILKQKQHLYDLNILKNKNNNLQLQLKKIINNYKLIQLQNNKYNQQIKIMTHSIYNLSEQNSKKDIIIYNYKQQILELKKYIQRINYQDKQKDQRIQGIEFQFNQLKNKIIGQKNRDFNYQQHQKPKQSRAEINSQYQSAQFTRSEYTFEPNMKQQDKLSITYQRAHTQPKKLSALIDNNHFQLQQQNLNELRKLLTYRMMGQKYTFVQLKADIQSSTIKSFSYIDICNMLINQPFYLTVQLAKRLLIFIFQKQKIKQTDQVDQITLFAKLKKVIDDFQLIQQKQEVEMMLRIADQLKKNKKKMIQGFNMKKNLEKTISISILQEILLKMNFSQKQRIMIVSELAVYSDDLNHLNYQLLFQRFILQGTNNSIQQVQNDDSFINSIESKSIQNRSVLRSKQSGRNTKVKRSHQIHIQDHIEDNMQNN